MIFAITCHCVFECGIKDYLLSINQGTVKGTKMKSTTSLIFIVAALCVVYVNSAPVHNGPHYYRAPSFNGYYRPYPMHQTMLLHYNNPYSARTSHASEITAFASGDRIGTGTTYYENGPEPAQEFQPPPPPPPKTSAPDSTEQSHDESSGNAVSIAESYPEEDEHQDTEAQQENDVFFEPNPTISYEPLPQKHNIAPTATTATAKPIIAEPPKINVEIESNDDEDDIVPVNTKKQQQPGGQGSYPLNNFFPISFGSTSGGAIAIANSFSTGKGGTAVSRATAYGSSSKQKLKKKLDLD